MCRGSPVCVWQVLPVTIFACAVILGHAHFKHHSSDSTSRRDGRVRCDWSRAFDPSIPYITSWHVMRRCRRVSFTGNHQ